MTQTKMGRRHKRHLFLLVALAFILASPNLGCMASQGSLNTGEKQEIIDYLKTMKPTMDAFAAWYDDWNKVLNDKTQDSSQFTARLFALQIRLQNISNEIGQSVPPKALEQFKRDWSKECQYLSQIMNLFARGVKENNPSVAKEGNKLALELNAFKKNYIAKYFDVLKKYDIDTTKL